MYQFGRQSTAIYCTVVVVPHLVIIVVLHSKTRHSGVCQLLSPSWALLQTTSVYGFALHCLHQLDSCTRDNSPDNIA